MVRYGISSFITNYCREGRFMEVDERSYTGQWLCKFMHAAELSRGLVKCRLLTHPLRVSN